MKNITYNVVNTETGEVYRWRLDGRRAGYMVREGQAKGLPVIMVEA